MRYPVRISATLAVLASLLLGASLEGQKNGDQRDSTPPPIIVTLDSPDPFGPAYGQVKIEAVVAAEEALERVVFYVDGIAVGEVTTPPYLFIADLGTNVGAHRFEVIAYGVSGASGGTHLLTPAFDVDEEVKITLQQLYVYVSKDDRPVLDLEEEDFEIFDEGNRHPLVTFARGDIPFTAALLVDASTSMEGVKLRSALAGARAFCDGMRPLDEGKLLVFSDRALHATPFTTFPEVLTAGLEGVRANGGTALADHLYLALKQLEGRQGRRVVVLLSDGVDSHSVLPMEDVLATARRSQALIYWLRLPYWSGRIANDTDLPSLTTPWRHPKEYHHQVRVLRKAVEESGGRVETLASPDHIQAAFEGILDELRQQYVLGYYPAGARHDGTWRKLRLKLRRQGLDVRCREGYVDF